jgi:hypothetical protein
VDIFERYAGIPKSTAMNYIQRLREDEKFFRRGRPGGGGVDVEIHEVTNATIALCAAAATTRSRPDALETVRRVRAAVRISNSDLEAMCPQHRLRGLAIANAQTAGEALDSLISDMRTGTYEKWTEGRAAAITIDFVNHGAQIRFYIRRYRPDEQRMESTTIIYRDESGNVASHGGCLTYIHSLDGDVILALAEALGPMPEAE